MVQRWNVCAIVFWRVVWYLRVHVPLYAIMSVAVVAVVVTSWLWPCRGVAVVPWTP